MTSFLRVALFVLALATACTADSWFPPAHEWTASRLTDLGLVRVRYDSRGLGGVLEGKSPGPILIYSSNRIELSLDMLARLGELASGKVVVVFGRDIELERGDYLVKLDYTDELPPGTVALPARGPNIDLYEVIITKGDVDSMIVASDYLLTLHTRARTSNEFVMISLVDYRPLADGRLAVDFSITFLKPELASRIEEAVKELAEERAALYGSSVASLRRTASPDSGKWPLLREVLSRHISPHKVITEKAPVTELSQEDFGLPAAPALTLRVSSRPGPELQEALAETLRGVLSLSR